MSRFRWWDAPNLPDEEGKLPKGLNIIVLQLRRPRLIFLLPLLLSAAIWSHRIWADRKPYVSHAFLSEATEQERNYAIVLPETYGDDDRAWPAIVYLHGLGEVGDDLTSLTQRGLVKELRDGLEIPFVVIAPQAMWTGDYVRGWKKNEADVLSVLADAQSRYSIDPDRIYLTGNSMGGIGSFYLASRYPTAFAAVAPIAGQGDAEWVAGYQSLPFWVFHGKKDDVIPASGSYRMVEAMREAAVDVTFTEYPDLTHDSWTRTYQNPDLYTWFLSHSRTDGTEEKSVHSSPAV